MILYLHLNHSLANTFFFHRFWHINILICHSVPSTFHSKFVVSTQHFLRLMARHSPSAPASIYSAVHASAVCSPRDVVRMSLVLYACVVASRIPAPTHLAPCRCIPPAAARPGRTQNISNARWSTVHCPLSSCALTIIHWPCANAKSPWLPFVSLVFRHYWAYFRLSLSKVTLDT